VAVRSDRLWRYLVCVGSGLLLIELLGPAWQTGFPPPFPDSSSYVAVAHAGIFSSDFWFGQRPPTYPLLIWLVGPSMRAVVVAQTLLAISAWGWLLSTVWQLIRTRAVAIALIAMLVGVALQTRWIFWDTLVLTESLSATLAVAGVAAWWRWWDEPSTFRTVAASAVTIAWMSLRDSNAVTFLVVAVPAMLVVLAMARRRPSDRRRLMAIALAAVVATGAYSVTAQVVSNRGETSFHNNVGLRWLPDPEMASWMEARGMPISDALLDRSGKDAWADGEQMLTADELQDYRDWADGRGRAVAGFSFVVKADWFLRRFDDELGGYAETDHLAYDEFDVAADFPERPLGFLDPAGARWSIYVWLVLGAAATAVSLIRWRTTGWLLVFLVVPIVSDLYLTFVADAIEVGRHLVGPMLRFSVVMPIAVAIAVDSWLATTGPDSEAGDG
jgi:hypothetical protein